MDEKIIDAFIEEHQSKYISKYKFYSYYKKSDHVYKFHYYMRDNQLQEINLFFEITDYEGIQVKFTEDIHDYEQRSLMIDALTRIKAVNNQSIITPKQIKDCIKKQTLIDIQPKDLNVILNYIQYHHGINQKSVDMFYSCYLTRFDQLIENREFSKCLEELLVIIDSIMYEHFWTGMFKDYLDQQYYYHLYYMRIIFERFCTKMNISGMIFKNEIHALFKSFAKYPRFTLCLISVLDNDTMQEYTKNILRSLITSAIRDVPENEDIKAFQYILSVYSGDSQLTYGIVQNIFRDITGDILRLANHDMQVALGTYFLVKYGYDILIYAFAIDYDAYLFQAFEIKDIPKEYYPTLQEQLRAAIYYYQELVDFEDTRLKSLDQIVRINDLILDYFKDTMYRE